MEMNSTKKTVQPVRRFSPLFSMRTLSLDPYKRFETNWRRDARS